MAAGAAGAAADQVLVAAGQLSKNGELCVVKAFGTDWGVI